MSNPESIGEINKRTIRALRSGIRQVGTSPVLKKLGFTSQNLSQHLSEKRAERANLAILEKIANAIAEVRQEKLDRARRVQKTVTNQ